MEDPELAVLTTQPSRLDQTTRSAAIASTIEMALLNCTHVLAIITERTAGSMWVPYEYGRVKDDDVVHAGAACWTLIDPGTEQFAEYVHLGVVARTIDEVEAWLRASSLTPG